MHRSSRLAVSTRSSGSLASYGISKGFSIDLLNEHELGLGFSHLRVTPSNRIERHLSKVVGQDTCLPNSILPGHLAQQRQLNFFGFSRGVCGVEHGLEFAVERASSLYRVSRLFQAERHTRSPTNPVFFVSRASTRASCFRDTISNPFAPKSTLRASDSAVGARGRILAAGRLDRNSQALTGARRHGEEPKYERIRSIHPRSPQFDSVPLCLCVRLIED